MFYLYALQSMIDDGASFEAQESWIDSQAIDDQSRSALWLYAFAELDLQRRADVIADALEHSLSAVG